MSGDGKHRQFGVVLATWHLVVVVLGIVDVVVVAVDVVVVVDVVVIIDVVVVVVGVSWGRKHERRRGNSCHITGICEGTGVLVTGLLT